MKPWYKSKTNWFGILLIVLPPLSYLADNGEMLKAYMTPGHFVAFSMITGVVVKVLRALTTTGSSFFGINLTGGQDETK